MHASSTIAQPKSGGSAITPPLLRRRPQPRIEIITRHFGRPLLVLGGNKGRRVALPYGDAVFPGGLRGGAVEEGIVGAAPSEEALAVHRRRSEEHTSELQSLMRNSYAVFCLKKKNQKTQKSKHT